MGDLPRSTIDELIARWVLERLRVLVVEGPSDQRALQLFQTEKTCVPELSKIDVWPVDAIDVPANAVAAEGFHGGGSRHRVVAFARVAERGEGRGGFRGLIDRDLDSIRGIDLRGDSVLYTDGGCLLAHFWTPEVLKRMLVQYLCEEVASSASDVDLLFHGITSVCGMLATVRLVAAENPSWHVKLHRSDSALELDGSHVKFDVVKYVSQCKLSRAVLDAAIQSLASARPRISGRELECINSHDLVWLCVWLFRGLTRGSRMLISEDLVSASLVAFGLLCADLGSARSMITLADWASAD